MGPSTPRRRALAFVGGLVAVGCGAPEPESPPTLRGATMGTTYTVTLATGPLSPADHDHLAAEVAGMLADLDVEKMSTYEPESELSRFNRTASVDWFPVSRETFQVFRDAYDVSEMTAGALDVTVAPLVDAWGFGPSGPSVTLPSDRDVEQLRARVGYSYLELDRSRPAIRKRHPEVRADLSAVAKGYAVDQVAALLDGQGFTSYLVEIGGEVRARGRNPSGRAWRVGIERPDVGTSALQRVVELADASLATSGDYRNYFERNGTTFSHTIDPRTGRPVTHRLASVSVIASRCARADAIATALEVLGPEEGLAIAVERNWAALFIVREDDGTFREVLSPAFQARLGSSSQVESTEVR